MDVELHHMHSDSIWLIGGPVKKKKAFSCVTQLKIPFKVQSIYS